MFRTKRKKIAIEVVDEIAKYLATPLVGDPEFLRGIFAGVCLRCGFKPTERDARRIFELVEKEVKLIRREAADFLRLAGGSIPSNLK